MTDELAGLPEDVREAFHVFEHYECDYPDTNRLDLVLRDYCLRLARENAELRKSRDDVVDEREGLRLRANAAEGELVHFEAELAALKRRIAEARRVMLLNRGKPDYSIESDTQCEIIDMCVALLPVGGEHER